MWMNVRTTMEGVLKYVLTLMADLNAPATQLGYIATLASDDLGCNVGKNYIATHPKSLHHTDMDNNGGCAQN